MFFPGQGCLHLANWCDHDSRRGGGQCQDNRDKLPVTPVDVFHLASVSISSYISTCQTLSIHQQEHLPKRAQSHHQVPIPSILHLPHLRPAVARSHSLRRPVFPQITQAQVNPLRPPHSPIWMCQSQMSLHPPTHPLLAPIQFKQVLSGWIFLDHHLYLIDSIMIDHRSNSKSQGLGMDIDLILYATSRQVMQWVHNLLDLHRLQILHLGKVGMEMGRMMRNR